MNWGLIGYLYFEPIPEQTSCIKKQGLHPPPRMGSVLHLTIIAFNSGEIEFF